MAIDEVEVYVTPDGWARAAIVRRSDGLYCMYVHRKLPPGAGIGHLTVRPDPRVSQSWMDDTTPLSELYRDKEPTSSIFGTLDDARRHIRGLPEFSEAVLKRAQDKA